MVRALRVALFAYGVIGLIIGLVALVFPDQMSEVFRFKETTDDIIVLSAVTGTFSIATGFWLIVAGRDPLRNIYWVKLVITKAILAVVVAVYLIVRGYSDFNQIGSMIIIDGIFAVAFLILYPWRATSINE